MTDTKTDVLPAVAVRLRTDLLAGTWVNTNTSSRWISRLTLTPAEGGLTASIVCGGNQWQDITIPVFGEHPADSTAVAFHSRYDSGPLDVRLQAYVVKGVLVVISFARTAVPDPFPACMIKEFFFRTGLA
jgi:hypothetical protein